MHLKNTHLKTFYPLGRFCLALCGLAALCRAAAEPGADPAAIVQMDGVSALRVPLEVHGGMVIPEPRAVFNSGSGAVAIETRIDSFPSNCPLLDFGNGTVNHIVVSESAGSTSAQGRIRFTVFGGDGKSRMLQGPMLDAGRTYLLAFSYRGNAFTFWVNGAAIGTIEGALTALPERLALVDPSGVRWKRVAIWSTERTAAQLEAFAKASRWPLEPKTTFLAVRDDQANAPQTGLIGSGLMAPAPVLESLGKPWARRELQVDAARGRDDGDGSAAMPFKTIGQAAAVAGPGDTVTVLPGVYRESVTLTHSGAEGAPITFRASPEGVVTLDGADPAGGFQSAGAIAGASLWVKAGFHSRDVPYGNDTLRRALSKQRPAAMKQIERRGRLDMLWCDGSLVPKADSRETLRSYSFWVDKEKSELLLALPLEDRPENHRLEIGMRGPLIAGASSYIHLQGFRLVHDDSPISHGAIDLTPSSSHWLIENVDESGASWCGVRVDGWGHVLRHNVWENNGDDGLDGSLLQYILVDGDVFRFNNWQRGINPEWNAGGVKFTQADHVTFRNCESAFNLGLGIWFDYNNSNLLIENCRSHHNQLGLFIEISPGPFVIRNNVCYANSEAGVAVGESSRGRIEQNTLVGNRSGIELRNIQGRGQNADGSLWQTSDIAIRRNVIAQNTEAGISNSVFPLDVAKDRISSDSNLFFQNGAIIGWPVKQSGGAEAKIDEATDWVPPATPGGLSKLLSLDAARARLGFETHSIIADPKFSFPYTYEWATDPHGPAARLQAGPDFPMQNSHD